MLWVIKEKSYKFILRISNPFQTEAAAAAMLEAEEFAGYFLRFSSKKKNNSRDRSPFPTPCVSWLRSHVELVVKWENNNNAPSISEHKNDKSEAEWWGKKSRSKPIPRTWRTIRCFSTIQFLLPLSSTLLVFFFFTASQQPHALERITRTNEPNENDETMLFQQSKNN